MTLSNVTHYALNNTHSVEYYSIFYILRVKRNVKVNIGKILIEIYLLDKARQTLYYYLISSKINLTCLQLNK